MDPTKSSERFLKALHEAADALVPGADDRRHGSSHEYVAALTRRSQACSRMVNVWISATPPEAMQDPNG